MKRILSICLILLFFVCSAYALATDVDFSQMTDDELVALKNSIDAEISARGIEDNDLIYPGTYIVGRDIKAGQYLISFVSGEYNRLRSVTFIDEEHYRLYLNSDRSTGAAESDALKANAESSVVVYESDIINLNLHEGMILIIEYGTGSLVSASPSWAP